MKSQQNLTCQSKFHFTPHALPLTQINFLYFSIYLYYSLGEEKIHYINNFCKGAILMKSTHFILSIVASSLFISSINIEAMESLRTRKKLSTRKFSIRHQTGFWPLQSHQENFKSHQKLPNTKMEIPTTSKKWLDFFESNQERFNKRQERKRKFEKQWKLRERQNKRQLQKPQKEITIPVNHLRRISQSLYNRLCRPTGYKPLSPAEIFDSLIAK